MENDWDKFWLPEIADNITKKPFVKNFKIIRKLINESLLEDEDNIDLSGKKTLEVGCGRGTISEMLLSTCKANTFQLDKYFIPGVGRSVKADAFDIPFDEFAFDVVFTYGLIEHFDFGDQLKILAESLRVTKYGGLNIHYIVPFKMTNFFENTFLRRDECKEILNMFNSMWVYPIFPFCSWKTNKWLGKGFFITIERGKYEFKNNCISNCKKRK